MLSDALTIHKHVRYLRLLRIRLLCTAGKFISAYHDNTLYIMYAVTNEEPAGWIDR